MDDPQNLIDETQTRIFRDKLKNVDAAKLEEAVRRIRRNATVSTTTDDAAVRCDGADKEARKTGNFRPND
jgi:hypothetical protein